MSMKDRLMGYMTIICLALIAYFPLAMCVLLALANVSQLFPDFFVWMSVETFHVSLVFLSVIWLRLVILFGADLCTKRPAITKSDPLSKPARSQERAEFEKQLWKAK